MLSQGFGLGTCRSQGSFPASGWCRSEALSLRSSGCGRCPPRSQGCVCSCAFSVLAVLSLLGCRVFPCSWLALGLRVLSFLSFGVLSLFLGHSRASVLVLLGLVSVPAPWLAQVCGFLGCAVAGCCLGFCAILKLQYRVFLGCGFMVFVLVLSKGVAWAILGHRGPFLFLDCP